MTATVVRQADSLERTRAPGSRRQHRLPYALGCVLLLTGVTCDRPIPSEPGAPRILWEVSGQGWGITPAFDSATAYFGGMDHDLVAVDKMTGEVRWRQTTDASGPYSFGWNLIRAGDLVIIGDRDLYAYDAATGAPRWMYQPADLDEPGQDFLATDGESVFAGSPQGRMYAIHAATGTERWITQLPGDSGVSAFAPVVAGGVIYVGFKEFTHYTTGGFAAIDAASGTILWIREFTPEFQGQGAGSFGAAAVVGPAVIVGAEDGRVYSLDRADGSVRWIAPRVHQLPPEGPYNDKRKLAAVGGTLVVGSNTGIIVGLDSETGAERWRARGSGGAASRTPASDGERAYVFFAGGEIIAFDGESGDIRWRAGITQSSPGQFFQPAADADHVYASGVNGFYALRKD